MRRTSMMSLLGKIACRLVLLALCLFAAFHLLAAVSAPILQALGNGLQRARTIEVVAIDEESTLYTGPMATGR